MLTNLLFRRRNLAFLLNDGFYLFFVCHHAAGIQGGCINCAMARTCAASQQNQQPIKPYLVYSKLRLVCKHLIPGQQEDAHEFLRYLMEAMEKAYLNRFPHSKQFDQHSKETTPINQILGGYLKTSVRCLSCHHVSVTFQHFEDLLLDIRKANTVEEALDLYFARERLEDMGYKCEGCKKKVTATKQFSLERAPIALCIQLKRFSMAGNKINKHISIREHLNLSKYGSKRGMNNTEQLTYRLVAMVTHLGASQHCGHYTAIGLTDAGGYYQFDDSSVRPISMQNVLNTNTYIIFYELETNPTNPTATWKTQQTVSEHNKYPQEQRNGLSAMQPTKPQCPSTQTSAKECSDSNQAAKRKIEINLKVNGTDNGVEHRPVNLNHVSHTQTSGSHRLIENGIDREVGMKPTINGLSTMPLLNPIRKHDYTTTETCTTRSSPILSNGYHSSAMLPSLPTLFDTDDIQFEAKINGAFRRVVSTNDSSNHTNTERGATTVGLTNGDCAVKPTEFAAIEVRAVSVTPEKQRRSLVPYTSDEDDSDDDDDNDNVFGPANLTETVKSSRSGPFQVTSTLPLKVAAERKSASPTIQITSASLVAFKRNHSDSALHDNMATPNKDKFDAVKLPATTKTNVIQKRMNSTVASNADQDADEPAKKLLKLSHRGYGTNVLSWNGNKSTMEKEVSHPCLVNNV